MCYEHFHSAKLLYSAYLCRMNILPIYVEWIFCLSMSNEYLPIYVEWIFCLSMSNEYSAYLSNEYLPIYVEWIFAYLCRMNILPIRSGWVIIFNGGFVIEFLKWMKSTRFLRKRWPQWLWWNMGLFFGGCRYKDVYPPKTWFII